MSTRWSTSTAFEIHRGLADVAGDQPRRRPADVEHLAPGQQEHHRARLQVGAELTRACDGLVVVLAERRRPTRLARDVPLRAQNHNG